MNPPLLLRKVKLLKRLNYASDEESACQKIGLVVSFKEHHE
jgi:hypothetical protein